LEKCFEKVVALLMGVDGDADLEWDAIGLARMMEMAGTETVDGSVIMEELEGGSGGVGVMMPRFGCYQCGRKKDWDVHQGVMGSCRWRRIRWDCH
jgi:hypothetical protein